MKKIVIIQHEPLTPNIENKFCLKELISAGFELEYWDVSQVIYPGLKVADEYNIEYLKKITNFSEFRKLWQLLPKDECIVIPEFFLIRKTKKMWELICHSGIPTVKFERYGNTILTKPNFLQKVVRNLSPHRFINCIDNQILKLESKILDLYQYDYILTSDANTKCTKRVNHPDYDTYLLHKNDSPMLQYKYICFADTGFGIHPDQLFYRTDLHNDNLLWQYKLSNFFTYLEKKYGIPVVIAVHPKLNYPKEAFGGRQKIKYETLNLILNAEFVLQDISNALSFSIIGDKKLRLITTNEFWKTYKLKLRDIGEKIKSSIFNIDKEKFESFEPLKIEESARNNYLYSFLTSKETENTLSSDILINFLKNF